MKKYDVTLTAHYEKTISVCAESAEQAKAKTEIILFDTDLISFADEDFVCGEAKINEACEDGTKDTDEEASEDERCSDCPYSVSYTHLYNAQKFLIHDYFFAKALDKVRAGGVVAFITSKGTMDKASPEIRKYIAQRAELLGAVRLPANCLLYTSRSV